MRPTSSASGRGDVSMETLFHLALADDWRDAQEAGAYRMSTIGQSIDDVGFIHCSFHHQVEGTASRYYAGRSDLVLLTIDPNLVGVEVRVENLHGGEELFPHLYGPLPVGAVVAVDAYDAPPA
jgi:glutathione S-transferase